VCGKITNNISANMYNQTIQVATASPKGTSASEDMTAQIFGQESELFECGTVAGLKGGQ
jgi:hypothetical protein